MPRDIKSAFSAEHRNEKVRAVLLAATEPLGPTAIAALIAEEWCCYGGLSSYGKSAAITPVARRIGATNTHGKYSLPTEGASA